MERSLFQNFLHTKQLEYRNYPPVEMAAEDRLFGGLGGGPGGGDPGSVGGKSEDRQSEAWENTPIPQLDDWDQRNYGSDEVCITSLCTNVRCTRSGRPSFGARSSIGSEK